LRGSEVVHAESKIARDLQIARHTVRFTFDLIARALGASSCSDVHVDIGRASACHFKTDPLDLGKLRAGDRHGDLRRRRPESRGHGPGTADISSVEAAALIHLAQPARVDRPIQAAPERDTKGCSCVDGSDLTRSKRQRPFLERDRCPCDLERGDGNGREYRRAHDESQCPLHGLVIPHRQVVRAPRSHVAA